MKNIISLAIFVFSCILSTAAQAEWCAPKFTQIDCTITGMPPNPYSCNNKSVSLKSKSNGVYGCRYFNPKYGAGACIFETLTPGQHQVCANIKNEKECKTLDYCTWLNRVL